MSDDMNATGVAMTAKHDDAEKKVRDGLIAMRRAMGIPDQGNADWYSINESFARFDKLLGGMANEKRKP
jgi:hypothetical protein